MEEKEKIIGSIVIGIVCIIFLAVGSFITKSNEGIENSRNKIFYNYNSKKKNNKKDNILVDNSNKIKNTTEIKNIVVEIKGEVKKPDVYTIEFGSRIKDLVEKSGGFTDRADRMSVNCSMKLKDEDCIIIYNKDYNKNNEVNIKNPSKKDGKININNATKEELKTLPSVGDTTAENIIDYREKNGKFDSIEDIMKVNRIGSKTFEKFKDKISV